VTTDRTGDAADRNDASYFHHPIEDLEPICNESNEYREAAKRQLFILNRSFDWILNSENKVIASWQVAFALGLICCRGRTMTSISQDLNIERATISKGAIKFCKENSLQPSFYMKKEECKESYRCARNKTIK
jgi:hypothetical protein